MRYTLKNKLEDKLAGAGIASAAILGTTLAIPAYTAVMHVGATLVGALGGELCDHLPYVHHAIPEGIAYIGNCFTEQDTVQKTAEYLKGNLDKLGAVSAFFGHRFKFHYHPEKAKKEE